MTSYDRPYNPRVIVRGWGDEPVVLLLYKIENNVCYVGSNQAAKPIGLPSNQVFAFDEQLFSQLNQAYIFHKWMELSTTYEQINVDDFACNKYRNKVLSSHDQEGIGDTECIAVSDRQ